MPVVPGRMFRGDIELTTDLVPADGYRLRILLVHKVTSRNRRRNSNSTTETMLWDSEIFLPASAALRSPTSTRVPFQFATPPDVHPTDDHDIYSQYLWRLTANAELPGVDYSAQFDLPVFKTGEVVDGSEYATFQQRQRAEGVRRRIAPGSGVEISALPGGGEEFRMHAAKTIGAALRGVILLAVWNAAIVASIHFALPWGVPAFLIAMDVLWILASINYYFGRSTVQVSASGMRVRKQWLGMGPAPRTYAPADIESIDGSTAGLESKVFGIEMKLSDGKIRGLASNLIDRESADAVAARMMADLKRA
jgi:hypothetical protein